MGAIKMKMVKQQTAFYVSLIEWFGGVYFGSSVIGAFITGLVTCIVLNRVATEINIITTKDTENETDEKEEN